MQASLLLALPLFCGCSQSISYSNSSLQSCCVVFFIGFADRNQGVLSDFYLLRGFSGDCIVILLSEQILTLEQYQMALFYYQNYLHSMPISAFYFQLFYMNVHLWKSMQAVYTLQLPVLSILKRHT